MDTDAVDEAFEQACKRLFHLHENGFIRPKPGAGRPARRQPSPTSRGAARSPQRVGALIF